MSTNHVSVDSLPAEVDRHSTRLCDLTGQRFGRLVAQYYAGRCGAVTQWVCLCDCGQYIIVHRGHLQSGRISSCGCLRAELTANRNRNSQHSRTHGLSDHPYYTIWAGMLHRCEHPNATGYANYGGRGIRVCDRWKQSFAAFIADMGERPSPSHSIDRINTYGDYAPDNCRWATAVEQSRNTRRNRWLTFRGKTLLVGQWAEALGMSYGTIYGRLQRGWTAQEALSLPRYAHAKSRG
ncbi:MAG: hypothetical protein WC114_02765 [Smithellaceae bacterium]|jgi:hypothetical protein